LKIEKCSIRPGGDTCKETVCFSRLKKNPTKTDKQALRSRLSVWTSIEVAGI
jgi:hypothetical protein